MSDNATVIGNIQGSHFRRHTSIQFGHITQTKCGARCSFEVCVIGAHDIGTNANLVFQAEHYNFEQDK